MKILFVILTAIAATLFLPNPYWIPFYVLAGLYIQVRLVKRFW